jgi:hypothetical protein
MGTTPHEIIMSGMAATYAVEHLLLKINPKLGLRNKRVTPEERSNLLDTDWEEIDQAFVRPRQQKTKRDGIYKTPTETISYEELTKQDCNLTH